jgi:hypothetical protein
MRPSTSWPGTAVELGALLEAIDRYCSCFVGRCAAHKLLLTDQATLDRLVFARRIAARLRREEGLSITDCATHGS